MLSRLHRHTLIMGVAVTLLVVPAVSQAAVVINEIAWMGTSVSANDEWIELHNNGSSSVSVEGWTLSDGGSLTINLTGTIGAGEYAVLERTDDDSAPGTAFLIYTGALNNTGVTLTLRDETSNIQDQVAGGENWENIGGDNTTKETPQLTEGGWVTAEATPGAASPGSGSSESEEDSEDEDEEDSSSGGGGGSSDDEDEETESTNNPALLVSAPKTGYLMQPLALSVTPAGMGDIYKNTMAYSWNFGDGTIETGSEVTHRWWFPGTYVLAVRGFAHDMEIMKKVTITILPAQISLEISDAGDLRIHSNSALESNLSGFVLQSGGKQFKIPNDTYLAPRGTLTLRLSTVGMAGARTVTLYDQAGRSIASYPEPREETVASAPLIEVEEVKTEEEVSAKDLSRGLTSGEREGDVAFVASAEGGKGEEGGGGVPMRELAYALLIGVIALATFALYAKSA